MPNNLPPQLSSFAALLDAQPEPVRAAFHYCLALMMVEAGKARLIETLPGEAEVREIVREILEEEGGL